MMLIEASGLHKSYVSGEAQTVKALDGVDLQLSKGAFAVLSGRSGSGKTTLLNMIGTLDHPDDGDLLIDGRNILDLSRSNRALFRLRHIGFVFQAYNLIRVLSARENVAYGLQLQGVAADERLQLADQWLAEVGMEGLEHRRPDQLSGGQQQRIAVARALASHPKIILADEPTANLDSHTGQSLIELMHRLNREKGMTFLIASHDPVVMESAQELYAMQDGRIIEKIER